MTIDRLFILMIFNINQSLKKIKSHIYSSKNFHQFKNFYRTFHKAERSNPIGLFCPIFASNNFFIKHSAYNFEFVKITNQVITSYKFNFLLSNYQSRSFSLTVIFVLRKFVSNYA